jgi:hypothetical protein
VRADDPKLRHFLVAQAYQELGRVVEWLRSSAPPAACLPKPNVLQAPEPFS